MKVKFLKDYKHDGPPKKFFLKGAIVHLTPPFAAKLIKKKVVEDTDEVSEEEKVIQKMREDKQ